MEKHEEIQMELNWKLHPYQLASVVLEGAILVAGEDSINNLTQLHNCVSCKNDMPARYIPWCHSGLSIQTSFGWT